MIEELALCAGPLDGCMELWFHQKPHLGLLKIPRCGHSIVEYTCKKKNEWRVGST